MAAKLRAFGRLRPEARRIILDELIELLVSCEVSDAAADSVR